MPLSDWIVAYSIELVVLALIIPAYVIGPLEDLIRGKNSSR
jgi:hypothetical protein